MQIANIMLALGGDMGNTVPKFGVTPAEVALLQILHKGGVFDVEVTGVAKSFDGDRPRSNTEELQRLKRTYHAKGPDNTRVVDQLYPGAAARVFEDFDELGLNDSLFKDPPVKKARGRKAKDEETESADSLMS